MKLSEAIERQIRGLVTNPQEFRDVVVGLHNACVHGEIITNTGAVITDDQLTDLFRGLETIVGVANDVVDAN